MDYETRKSAENKKHSERTLAEELSMWRAERPDEWKMDEFIRGAKELEAQLTDAREENKELKELLVCENKDCSFNVGSMNVCSFPSRCGKKDD